MDGIDGWDDRRKKTWEENENEKRGRTYGGMFRRARIRHASYKPVAERTPTSGDTDIHTHTASTFYEKQNNSTHLYH
jgi:hypothetical protein